MAKYFSRPGKIMEFEKRAKIMEFLNASWKNHHRNLAFLVLSHATFEIFLLAMRPNRCDPMMVLLSVHIII